MLANVLGQDLQNRTFQSGSCLPNDRGNDYSKPHDFCQTRFSTATNVKPIDMAIGRTESRSRSSWEVFIVCLKLFRCLLFLGHEKSEGSPNESDSDHKQPIHSILPQSIEWTKPTLDYSGWTLFDEPNHRWNAWLLYCRSALSIWMSYCLLRVW